MVSRRIYLTITMLIITVFIMFMFVGMSTEIIYRKSMKLQDTDNFQKNYYDALTAERLNIDNVDNYLYSKKSAAIIAGDEHDILTDLIIEWCVYNKYLYKIYTSLPAEDEIINYNLIIFGNIELSKADKEILYTFADLGKTMIFTKLPDYQLINSDRDFAKFFGIDAALKREVNADGIMIFPKFLIGGERIYQKGDYFGSKDDTSVNVPHYKLSPGYKVYAVGLFDDYEEFGIEHIDLPPLLWRTKTKNSFVFVVGSDIFRGMPLLGILTGFMAQESTVYLYPVVNAQTISLVDFPCFSNENEKTMKHIYSRNSEDLSRDILWPNIIQILKNYGGSYNFFAASQLDYLDNGEPSATYLEFYFKEIDKFAGTVGLSLSQISKADLNNIIDKNHLYYRENIPNYRFRTLYLGGFQEEEIIKKLDHELLKNISLVMSDYNEGDKLIDLIDDDVLSIKFNLYGYQHETLDDLGMFSIENALGMCNMKVDISRVLFPKDSFDEWNNLSLIWSKGDTYFKDFTIFDMVSVSELESRVRRFLALDYIYEYDEDAINIRIENFDEEAYFILYLYNKRIELVENCKYSKINDHTYLIKAVDTEVNIQLKDKNMLESPKSGKIVPHKP